MEPCLVDIYLIVWCPITSRSQQKKFEDENGGIDWVVDGNKVNGIAVKKEDLKMRTNEVGRGGYVVKTVLDDEDEGEYGDDV